jgi:hypothetical protein
MEYNIVNLIIHGLQSFHDLSILSKKKRAFCFPCFPFYQNPPKFPTFTEYDVLCHPKFQIMSSFFELCQKLVETRKGSIYFLIDILVHLVLTLPVSTATTERAFSAMKLVKTTLRNKMEDEFLANCLTVYIEREFVENIDSDSIIDDFYSLKDRRAPLK